MPNHPLCFVCLHRRMFHAQWPDGARECRIPGCDCAQFARDGAHQRTLPTRARMRKLRMSADGPVLDWVH